jgi:hypothetical protein
MIYNSDKSLQCMSSSSNCERHADIVAKVGRSHNGRKAYYRAWMDSNKILTVDAAQEVLPHPAW